MDSDGQLRTHIYLVSRVQNVRLKEMPLQLSLSARKGPNSGFDDVHFCVRSNTHSLAATRFISSAEIFIFPRIGRSQTERCNFPPRFWTADRKTEVQLLRLKKSVFQKYDYSRQRVGFFL